MVCIIYDFAYKFPIFFPGVYPFAFLLAVYDSEINVGQFPESQYLEWLG